MLFKKTSDGFQGFNFSKTLSNFPQNHHSSLTETNVIVAIDRETPLRLAASTFRESNLTSVYRLDCKLNQLKIQFTMVYWTAW